MNSIFEQRMGLFQPTIAELSPLLPYPAENANKYSRGTLTAVVGDASYPGAACLASYAAQRMGVGYVRVLCASETMPILRGFRPSLVVDSWERDLAEHLPKVRVERPAACLVGSGMDGEDVEERALALRVIAQCEVPLVIDGGALGALATTSGIATARERRRAERISVITPHGGEAARLVDALALLFGQDVDGSGFSDLDGDLNGMGHREKADLEASGFGYGEVDKLRTTSDPAEKARLLSLGYGALVVLKGPDTYISDGMRTACITQGTAALAKAGTGDVLAGMVAALVAQGIHPFDASVLGVTLHAFAGNVAAEEYTSIGVEPEDVIDALPAAFRRFA